MNIFNDKPIVKIEEDKLNRSDFSKRISKSLIQNQKLDNLVISLNGQWGSGKSSILNMVKEDIAISSINKDINVFNIPIIVDFSPWNVLSQNDIIKQFLNTLLENFKYAKIKKQISLIGKILVNNPVTNILEYTPIPANVIKAIKSVEKVFSDYIVSLENKNGDLTTMKNAVENKLINSKLHYIVFIDDLDRLNDSEIKLVFQLIKAVCNFSNITYVLAYDKNVISKALEHEQAGCNGQMYLEKLVQVEFDVPEIRQERIMEIASKDLEYILSDKCNDISKERLSSLVFHGFLKSCKTLREEKRFFNYFSFYLDSFYEEIDITDLLGITYLKFLDDRIIDTLINYQSWLFGKGYVSSNNELTNAKNAFFKELMETRYLELNEGYLNDLFPYMFCYHHGEIEDNLIECRIGKPDRFNLFLNLDLNTNDISMKELTFALKNNDVDKLISYANCLKKEQGRSFLITLVSFSKRAKDIDTFRFLLNFVFKNISKIHFAEELFLVGREYYQEAICASALDNIDIKKANELIVEAVSNSDDVFSLVSFSRDLDTNRVEKLVGLKNISKETINSICDRAFKLLLERIDIDIDSIADSSRIINYGIFKKADEIKRIIERKDEKYIIDFINKIMYIGKVSVSSSNGSGSYNTFAFNLDNWNKVSGDWNLKLDDLLNKSNNCDRLAIIVLKMQLDGIEPYDVDIKQYKMSQIVDYCKNNKIDFDSSKYELC